MNLDDDVVKKILGYVDSKTLANAACVSSQFWSIAGQDGMWEEACFHRWPSTRNPQLKNLIFSSLGGFRKFYANCFSVIAFPSDSTVNVDSENIGDLMWVVDVQYDNNPIFSKIVWGIPYAAISAQWFLQSLFYTDIINLEDVNSNEDELPTIMSVDDLGNVGKIWRQLTEKIRLSWIVINKRTGQAANLSSWSPLAGQKCPSSGVKYVVSFGSLLPVVVKCVVEMNCRVLGCDDHSTLKMSGVSVRLEDMSGNDVNGSEGLGILGRALH